MGKSHQSDSDQPIYVRLPTSMVSKLDKRVARERRERKGEVDEKSISRSSVIRSAVVKLLEDT